MNLIQNGLKDSIAAAEDFQTRIEDIQTISADKLGSSSQIADQVKQVSNAFNVPLQEASKGLYQTISSGIGRSAENVEFLGKAAQFAKATLTPLDQSVLLLSGSLNAYGRTAKDTDEISSKFAKTIKLGAVRGTDLAATFGRVAPWLRIWVSASKKSMLPSHRKPFGASRPPKPVRHFVAC